MNEQPSNAESESEGEVYQSSLLPSLILKSSNNIGNVLLPQFIAIQNNNNTCLSKICPCLFSTEKYSTANIKQSDLQTYYALKGIASLEYDQYNTVHEESLQLLYMKTLANTNKSNSLSKDLITAQWETIGFNSWNPREDFKEGGYYSLLFIIYFASRKETDLKEICALNHFNFALVSIKITFYFKLALDLFNDEKYCQDKRTLNTIQAVNVPQYKAFIFNQSRDMNYCFKLLTRILIVIKDNYATRMKNSKNSNGIDEKDMNTIIQRSFNGLIYPDLDREYSLIALNLSRNYDLKDEEYYDS